MKKFIKITKALLLSVLIILVVYDIVIVCLRAFDATISYQTWMASEKFIFFPVMWGTMATHFFASKIGKKLFGRIPKIRFAIWIPQGAVLLIICIIGLFKTIPALVWVGDNLYIPLVYGMGLGLMWYKEKKNNEA